MVPPKQDGEDERIWKYDKSGKYTVRSAYRVAMEEMDGIGVLSVPGPWAKLWRLKIPPKSKQHLWRIARGVDWQTRAGD
ncbi:hypothetical protein LINPERPRIM_LOCUS20016 [Linum perenne]